MTPKEIADSICAKINLNYPAPVVSTDDVIEVRKTVTEAVETAFRSGFEHAVAGGDEAAKKHGIDPATLPLVMYFDNEEDRNEMIRACKIAIPTLAEVKIPERAK